MGDCVQWSYPPRGKRASRSMNEALETCARAAKKLRLNPSNEARVAMEAATAQVKETAERQQQAENYQAVAKLRDAAEGGPNPVAVMFRKWRTRLGPCTRRGAGGCYRRD